MCKAAQGSAARYWLSGTRTATPSGILGQHMHDSEQVERFRKMTPAERWEVWRELAELGMSLWDQNLTAAEIDRRWRVWRREHDLSDANMLRAFRSAT